MSIIVFQVPDVKSSTEDRPHRCPYCPGETFQRWGRVAKAVRDVHLSTVQVDRYRCCGCQRTFRHYPEGVDPADQTQRLRALVALFWILGMSYRGLVHALAALGVSLERMSAWRDMQALAKQDQHKRHWGRVRILGLDGAYVRGWGKTQPILIAVDLGTGQPVAIGYLDEHNPQALRRFLEPLVQRLGVGVIVTDDLDSYKQVAERLGLEQQVCQFHLRRWVGRSLGELREAVPEDWKWVVLEVGQLIQDMPPQGDRRLLELYRQLPANRQGRREEAMTPLEQLRHLIARLMEDWSKYRVFDWDQEVPWTNNATEQVICRMKMRARTVRGYKTWPGMQNALWLSGTRWG